MSILVVEIIIIKKKKKKKKEFFNWRYVAAVRLGDSYE